MKPSLFWVLALGLLTLASPSAAEPVAVGGRVLGASGQALAGVPVELVAEPRLASSQSEPERALVSPAARGTTGPDGGFRLLAPEPGLWRLRAMTAGFPAMEYLLHPLLQEVQVAPLVLGGKGPEPTVPPASGWRRESPPGKQQGEGAPASASGKVVDALTGEPVSAFVWPAAAPGAAVRTASDGRFLAQLPAGAPPLLHAAASGYLVALLEVPRGSREAGLIRLQPAATLAGQVVDRSGRPVADAAVRVAFGAHLVPGIETFSRTDGSFLLGGVPPERPGELRASVVAKGRRLAARQPMLTLLPRERRLSLRFILSASPRVTGRVVASDGRAVAGARLRLIPEPRQSELELDRRPAAEVWSLDDGHFELIDAGLGRFRLEVEAEGFVSKALPQVELSETGGDRNLGNLVLRPGATLRGIILDEERAPVAGAAVEARTTEEGGSWRAESSADGSFMLPALTPGAGLEVSVRHRDFAPAVLLDVEVSREPLEIVLHPGASLAGQVVDAAGRGVGEAVVVVSAMPDPRNPVSAQGLSEKIAVEPDGRFALLHVPPGTISLHASARGYRDAELNGIEVGPGESQDGLELVLEQSAVLLGQVRSSDGAPLPDAKVTVRGQEADEGVLGVAVAAADGSFRIEGLEPGQVEAEADHPHFRRAVRSLSLSLGENHVELMLGRGLTLSGQVVDRDGAPLKGAKLEVEEVPGAPPSKSAVSLADGSFRLTGLEPGHLALTARLERFAPARLEVELGEQPIEGVVVRLERGAVIQGRLLGLNASELGRAEVIAFAPDRGIYTGKTEPGGRYRIEGLAAGEWTVVAAVAPGDRQARGSVRLDAGEEELDLDFGGGLRLTGRLRVDAQPLAGVEVTLLGLAGQGPAETLTGPSGEFELSGLAAGAYRLRFEQRLSGLSHEQTLELTQDRDVTVELASNRVFGQVLSADTSAPLAEARVLLEPLRGGQGAAAVTDSTGFFLLSLVPEGEYRLRVDKPGFAPADQGLSVAAGSPIEITLVLEAR